MRPRNATFVWLLVFLISCVVSVSASNVNVTKVNTTSELEAALTTSTANIIELLDGVYSGQFELNRDNVVLKGQGQGTIIKLGNSTTVPGPEYNSSEVALDIFGHNCTIQGLTIINSKSNKNNDTKGIRISGFNNTLRNIGFDGFTTAVLVSSSDYNKFLNISITNGADGYLLFGNWSSLVNVVFENMTSHPIWIQGDTNTVSNLTCDNCRNGLYLKGIENWVANVELKNPRYDYNLTFGWGFFVGGGSGNVLDNFEGEGYQLGLDCYSSLVKNSRFEGVDIWQFNNTLQNVDVGQWLMISGGGHRIIKTRARELVNDGVNVVFINSTFGSVGPSDTSPGSRPGRVFYQLILITLALLCK